MHNAKCKPERRDGFRFQTVLVTFWAVVVQMDLLSQSHWCQRKLSDAEICANSHQVTAPHFPGQLSHRPQFRLTSGCGEVPSSRTCFPFLDKIIQSSLWMSRLLCNLPSNQVKNPLTWLVTNCDLENAFLVSLGELSNVNAVWRASIQLWISSSVSALQTNLAQGPVHTGRESRSACKFVRKPFDIACNLCEHSHWPQCVP